MSWVRISAGIFWFLRRLEECPGPLGEEGIKYPCWGTVLATSVGQRPQKAIRLDRPGNPGTSEFTDHFQFKLSFLCEVAQSRRYKLIRL
jgi:hypothetical protein